MYRRQGYSYEKICKLINVSKSTVAAYCRRHDIRPITHVKESTTEEKRADANLFCKYCGCELIQSSRGKPKKFCSEACRRNWWKDNEQALNKKAYYFVTCKNCNKLFESYGNKNRKYCCHECYIFDVFIKKRESIKDIRKIIIEFFNETNSLISCEKSIECTDYTEKLLEKKPIDKLVNKYSTFIYELQNKGMEEK
jgi:hypothetical protein